jgi:myo-inositol-1(or 4)-monophosphatase
VKDADRLLREAEAVLKRAGARLVAMQDRPLKARRKDRLDVVTDADLAAERIIINGLRALTPGAAILSEEQGASGAQSGPRWIIDPLDGTVNYASGLPWFSATVAYQEAGETLLGLTHAPRAGLVARYVRSGEATVNGRSARVSEVAALADAVVSVVLTAHFTPAESARAIRAVERLSRVVRGVRIVVSGAYEMSLVAAGRMAGFVGLKADIVSHAAAMPLVRAAGGRVTRLDGRESADDDLQKIASNGLIHDQLLECLQGIDRA